MFSPDPNLCVIYVVMSWVNIWLGYPLLSSSDLTLRVDASPCWFHLSLTQLVHLTKDRRSRCLYLSLRTWILSRRDNKRVLWWGISAVFSGWNWEVLKKRVAPNGTSCRDASVTRNQTGTRSAQRWSNTGPAPHTLFRSSYMLYSVRLTLSSVCLILSDTCTHHSLFHHKK